MKKATLLLALGVIASIGTHALMAQTAISADGVIESTSGGLKFPDGTVQATGATGNAALVPDTGQQSCYDPATGGSTPCAGTGQDGEYQAGVAWPTPRFTKNNDGTVTDNLTGLVWLENADCGAYMDWAEALAFANTLFDGSVAHNSGDCGLSDSSAVGVWRLPNLRELQSLVHYGVFSLLIRCAS